MKKIIYAEHDNLFEPNDYIRFIVNLSGEINSNILKETVEYVFKLNESTMSKISFGQDGQSYYEKMEQSGCRVCITKKSWRELINQNERVPFAIDKGELMRVFIIQGENETTLLIMSHHLVGDGKSILYFVEQVMKSLSGEKLEYKSLKLLDPNLIDKKYHLKNYIYRYTKSINKKWEITKKAFTWEDYYNIHNTYWSKHSTNVLYRKITSDDMDRLKSFARENNVTINSIIITSFLKASKKKQSVGIPVSIRKDNNRNMSNQTTGISIKYKYSERKSFVKNAIAVHKRIYKIINQPSMLYFVPQFMSLINPNLINSVLMYTQGLYYNEITKKVARVIGFSGKNIKDIGVTNLTKADIKTKYDNFNIDSIIFVPPVVSYAKQIIGVLTTDNCMVFSYSYMQTPDETQINIFNEGVDYLLQIINTQ